MKENDEPVKIEIKAHPELCDIPTVMYTTSNNEHDIKETYVAGANLFVQKPTIFNKLIRILKWILTMDWKDFMPSARQILRLRKRHRRIILYYFI